MIRLPLADTSGAEWRERVRSRLKWLLNRRGLRCVGLSRRPRGRTLWGLFERTRERGRRRQRR